MGGYARIMLDCARTSECLLKAIYLLISIFLLQSCHDGATEEHTLGKAKLSEAASYNTQLGLAYLKQGHRSRAKQKLLVALSEAPNASYTNAAMAYFMETTGDINGARTYYQKALSAAPRSGAPLNNYGAFLCRQRQYRQAEGYFLKAVNDKDYVNTAFAYENAGLCAMGIPDEKKAANYFVKALQQDPSRKPSLYELVTITINQGKLTDALAYLQRYPNLTRHDSTLLALAENVARRAGEKGLASDYQLRLQRFSDNTGVTYEHNNHSG